MDTIDTMDTMIDTDSLAELEAAAHRNATEALRLRARARKLHPIAGEACLRRAAELELMSYVYGLKAEAWAWEPSSDTTDAPVAAATTTTTTAAATTEALVTAASATVAAPAVSAPATVAA